MADLRLTFSANDDYERNEETYVSCKLNSGSQL